MAPANNKMQQSRHGLNGASLLISADVCGQKARTGRRIEALGAGRTSQCVRGLR
jgi:hypothetical protein